MRAIGGPAEIAQRYGRPTAARGTAHTDTRSDRGRPSPTEPAVAPPRPARYRPQALGGSARRFAAMTYTLAAVDFKLHYLGSSLGYLWSLLRPLMLFAVTYFVFTRVASFGEGVRDYPVYLLTSIVLWMFFAESTTTAAGCLVGKQELLRKLRFPRLAIPLSVVLKALFNLGMNLLAVAVLLAVSGVAPRLSWLQLPLLVGFLVALSTGVAMLVSALYVRFRDVAQIWAVLVQLLFFGSAVLYVITEFPESVQRAMVANPLAMVFTQMRHALIDPAAPTAAEVAGSAAALAIPLVMVAAVLALGLWVFARESRTMAENV